MRYKMYAVVLASMLLVASTGCQAINVGNRESGSTMGGGPSCGCQNCRNASLPGGSAGYQGGPNGMSDPSQMGGAHANGFAGQSGGPFDSAGQAGAYGAGGMGMGGGVDLGACPSCSRLGRPCATCLAPGGRLAGLAGGAAGKARGLFGKLINRVAAHDCQTPHTQPFAESGLPGGPMTATYGYPYYTTRAPRDYFACNPPSIGP